MKETKLEETLFSEENPDVRGTISIPEGMVSGPQISDPNVIRTYVGIYMDPLNAKEEDINIEDIAHALSQESRFSGHTKKFYSVAEHSVFCADHAKDFKLECLLHDAAEAYLRDIATPIKRRFPEFLKAEQNLMKVIASKFDLKFPFPEEVHRVDKLALNEEWDALMIGGWRYSKSPLNNPMTSEEAKKAFLERFHGLMMMRDINKSGRLYPKICIIGNAQHGKDTVAAILESKYGLTYSSSSMKAAQIFLFDKLKEKYGYETFQDCFDDRVNHRAEWHDLICEYNKDDKARLAKDILESSCVYVGMRSNEEMQECKRQGLFDYVLAVYDARKPLESSDSFNIDLFGEMSYLILNYGTIEQLEIEVDEFMSGIIKEMQEDTYATRRSVR